MLRRVSFAIRSSFSFTSGRTRIVIVVLAVILGSVFKCVHVNTANHPSPQFTIRTILDPEVIQSNDVVGQKAIQIRRTKRYCFMKHLPARSDLTSKSRMLRTRHGGFCSDEAHTSWSKKLQERITAGGGRTAIRIAAPDRP